MTITKKLLSVLALALVLQNSVVSVASAQDFDSDEEFTSEAAQFEDDLRPTVAPTATTSDDQASIQAEPIEPIEASEDELDY